MSSVLRSTPWSVETSGTDDHHPTDGHDTYDVETVPPVSQVTVGNGGSLTKCGIRRGFG